MYQSSDRSTLLDSIPKRSWLTESNAMWAYALVARVRSSNVNRAIYMQFRALSDDISAR